MEMNWPDAIAALCVRVEEALKDLPGPAVAPREEFFAPHNLWIMEVRFTCEQSIEYVRGILFLLDQGLNRPAAALSRSIYECWIRFEYLLDHEAELRDWFEWQISHDYHSCLERSLYDADLGATDKQGLQEDMNIMEGLLGEVPRKRGHQWKSPGSMLKDISRNLPAGSHPLLRRHLIAYPSEYVHIRARSVPPSGPIIGLSAIFFTEIVKKAMKLCLDTQLIDVPAGEIEALCDTVRSATAPR